MKRVGFTGHRDCVSNEWTHDTLNSAVKRSVEGGARWFTSGGAIGWDVNFLEAAMVERWNLAGKPTTTFSGMFDVKGLPDGIAVAAALPFRGFWDHYKNKRDDNRIYFDNLEKQLDVIAYISEGGYEVSKMHKRNRWIVDNSDVMITVYDGRKKGGTYKTLSYAKKQRKPILWLNPVSQAERWIRHGVDYA